MSKKLAIKGHPTRGKEVIELLKMLGGKGSESFHCSDLNRFYYISYYESISWDYIGSEEIDEYHIFTLEEFLEKFPFKVGDFVCIPEYESEVRICKMKWTSFSDIDYLVYRNDDEEWYTAYELLEYNDNPNKMNEIKPLFKAGDVVKLKGDPDENLFWIVMDVVKDGYIFNDASKCSFDDQHHYEKSNREIINAIDITVKVVDKNHKMGPKSKLPSKYYEETITPVITTEVIDNSIDSVQFIQNGKIVAVHLNTQNYENEVELQLGDYEIEVRDGKTYAVLKNPKYPTTYAECCEVLVGRKTKPNEISFDKMELCLVDLDNTQSIDFQNPYLPQFNSLFRLRMCRDAYWKIYGEETGLGKPWKPNFGKYVLFDIKFYLYQDNFVLHKGEYNCSDNCILVFPTEEMRDTFYENFKDLIEQCKELL